MPHQSTPLTRTAVAVAAGLGGTLLLASPASAHVTVTPSDAIQGGYSKITFRVPNETDGAVTTKVEIDLPADTPIASVSIKPTAGWTAVATTSRLATPIKSDDGEVTDAVSRIVWTAGSEGAGIQVGQFQEFDISAGPLPETDKIVFKALQTYSDGDVVRWIEEPAADGQEPENPAPTLTLAKAAGSATTTTTHGHGLTASAVDSTARSRSTLGLGIGIAALAVALAAAALARRRQPTA